MKRVAAILSILMLFVLLIGCGANNDPGGNNPSVNPGEDSGGLELPEGFPSIIPFPGDAEFIFIDEGVNFGKQWFNTRFYTDLSIEAARDFYKGSLENYAETDIEATLFQDEGSLGGWLVDVSIDDLEDRTTVSVDVYQK